MFRSIFTTALIGAASLVAAPALAGPGGGHGGGGGGAVMGSQVGIPGGSMAGPDRLGTNFRVNSQASMHASPMASTRSNARSAVRMSTAMPRARVHSARIARTRANVSARTNSQGLMHASFTAIERANSRSALARDAVRASALPGLSTGLTVKGRGGATVGTVSRIVTGTDGKIRLVVASSTSGRMIRLAPNTLSVSGSTVTTTML